MPVNVEIPVEKWPGSVRQVTLGATAAEGGTRQHTVAVGGANTLPFLGFEGTLPHRPQIAIEVRSSNPGEEWPEPLSSAWGDVLDDPAAWAKAAEAAGAELILLRLTSTDNTGASMTAAKARKVLRGVLGATGLPLIVLGPGQAELDNELLVAVAEEGVGERLVLGYCEDKNYRTIVAAALAHHHLVISRTPMDVNLAKQLTILIHDMGLPLERIVMDPTTGALGYGMEYGYSVMERLRLAALQGDIMTQQPMIVTPGEEAWRTKEARAGEGVPGAWGDWAQRAVNWEALTAAALVESGADIIVLRHPETVARVKRMITELMAA
ncbi:MAG: acetyl-CoA decarbonylase/synthase complex subunit delta [Chloroflexi bacterium HGW-Chloroflexi-1]|nr:MAG: acetyl-CoA decarbonylase/synthase complex subunit delta [Chloroflexi bacterium HGW-Chloroflexi-1]